MARHFYLTPVLGGPGAPRYPIGPEGQLVGRSEGANIALLEPTVSREHAMVQRREGKVHLEDLGSKHGTFVNSKRVVNTTLKVGDIVVFGLSLVLRLEESDKPVPPAPAVQSDRPEPTSPSGSRSRQQRVLREGDTAVSGEPDGAAQELQRARELVVRLRKLASIGALCALRIPALYEDLGRIGASLQHGAVDGGRLMAELRPVLEQLDALLDDAGVARPNLAPANIFDLARRAVAEVTPAAKQRDVELLVNVPGEVAVLTDAPRLRSALTQLLRNAVFASPAGTAVEITGVVDEGWVMLNVTDSGEGIPEDVRERVFDPFVTLRDDWQAVGLGLFEARQTIYALGGSLSLDDAPAGGMTVRLYLPLA